MNRIRYYLFPAFILLHIYSYGQYFKKLGMEDGLSNPSVLAICQDTLGRMWFGTNEGVNVYNGEEILKYKSYEVPGRSPQKVLMNGTVNQIVSNSQGDIFMRNNGVLIKYDIRKERFMELYPYRVSALAAIKGRIWCAVRDSVFIHDA